MTATPTPHSRATPEVLIIGATGGLGLAMARNLLRRGWGVRALTRHADMAQRVHAGEATWRGLEGVRWHLGDAMNTDDVIQAARQGMGVDFIVHAANPPRYQRWGELAMPMLASSVAAARAVGARLVMPGNVYNFGPDAGMFISEEAPQHPLTGKGQVRVEMEQLLRKAAQDPHAPVRSLVLRAGDFFGGHAPASWFGQLMVKAGRPVRRVIYPGVADVGHNWAYLPDVVEAAARLMALDIREPGKLADFETLHFGGHWLPRGIEMAEAIRRVAGQGSAPIRGMQWALVTLLSPFVPLLREIREMRYLWRVPLRLDNRKLLALLGEEPHTPLDEAVRASLEHMGCLGQDPGMAPSIRTAG